MTRTVLEYLSQLHLPRFVCGRRQTQFGLRRLGGGLAFKDPQHLASLLASRRQDGFELSVQVEVLRTKNAKQEFVDGFGALDVVDVAQTPLLRLVAVEDQALYLAGDLVLPVELTENN